jgi:hypothetical protein
MLARLDNVRKHPAVFRHLTGLTVAAFDALAADVVPAVETAHRKSLDRPDRERAIGAGGEFGLTRVWQIFWEVKRRWGAVTSSSHPRHRFVPVPPVT